jgi:hypothetical protein
MYNVTMRRVHAKLMLWKSKKYYIFLCARVCVCACVGVWVCGWMWVCACGYTGAPSYCHLQPLWLHKIFRHYLVKGMIFVKKVSEHKMCVSILSTTFILNISHSKKNSTRYFYKCEKSSCKVLFILFGY